MLREKALCSRHRHIYSTTATTALACHVLATSVLLAYFSPHLNRNLNLIKDESGLEIFSYDTFYDMIVQ